MSSEIKAVTTGLIIVLTCGIYAPKCFPDCFACLLALKAMITLFYFWKFLSHLPPVRQTWNYDWSGLVDAVFRSELMRVLWVWRRSTSDWRWPSAYRFSLLWPRLTCARQTSCKKRCTCCTRFWSHRDVARCPFLSRQSTTWSSRRWTSLRNGKTKLCHWWWQIRIVLLQLYETKFETVFLVGILRGIVFTVRYCLQCFDTVGWASGRGPG